MDVFTEQEVQQLIYALGKGQDVFTEQEAVQVYDWAADIKIKGVILDQVLSGQLKLAVRGREIFVSLMEKKDE